MPKSPKDPIPKRDRPKRAGVDPLAGVSKGRAPRLEMEHGEANELHQRLSEGSTEGYLTGQLLIAMPTMMDPRFQRTVIFMCAHDERGAMGLVLNRLIEALTFPELLKQLGIDNAETEERPIHFGGPVDMGRGFVLHSDDYNQDGTVPVKPGYSVTATVDILHAMAKGDGPQNCLLALGYAGWGPGQLDDEIQANGWLHAPADPKLVFDPDLESKWERAMAKIGVDLTVLSGEAGHA
jgi:putative transcriptional regulator